MMRDGIGAMVMLNPEKSRQISPDGTVMRPGTARENDELLIIRMQGWWDSFIDLPAQSALVAVTGGALYLLLGVTAGFLATCGLPLSAATLLGGKVLTLGMASGGGILTIRGLSNAIQRFSHKQ